MLERSRTLLLRLLLALASLACTFLVLEVGYRLLDPFWLPEPHQVNHTDHGNLSQYDSVLGWRGVPNGRAEMVTWNQAVLLEHNSGGHRDVEHEAPTTRPAVVFLGDSFTWGYEVAWSEMFVNRVRTELTGHEVYNLAHRGYGTDQSLLMFESWEAPANLELVVLMFSENDPGENESGIAYGKRKPFFEIVKGRPRVTGIPVVRVEAWTAPTAPRQALAVPRGLGGPLRNSHLARDVGHRLDLQARAPHTFRPPPPLDRTFALLADLDRRVRSRGAVLKLVFIPSKLEVEGAADYPPYQAAIAAGAAELGIESFDLAPALKDSWRRSYYRLGLHWNAHGHRVAADAVHAQIQREAWVEPAGGLRPAP